MLGERSSILLRAGGATIGRSPSNDWVLPDPQRYVSARHARIAWRNGQYFVEDLSTNGVYVNEDERPLGKDVARQLCTGDVLRVGEYQLAVAFEEEPRPAAAAPPKHGRRRSRCRRASGSCARVNRTAQPDLGAPLDLGDLLVPDLPSNSGLQPVNAFGQAVTAASQAQVFAETSPGLDDEAIARRIARLARAAQRNPKNRASVPALFDVQSGLAAFCRGAGIDQRAFAGRCADSVDASGGSARARGTRWPEGSGASAQRDP